MCIELSKSGSKGETQPRWEGWTSDKTCSLVPNYAVACKAVDEHLKTLLLLDPDKEQEAMLLLASID